MFKWNRQCPTQGYLITPGFHLKIPFVIENISPVLPEIWNYAIFQHSALSIVNLAFF